MSTLDKTPVESELAGLADRIARGDCVAEDRIVQMFAGRVLAMAIVRTRDREASRELVNDVLMATIEALRRGAVRDTGRLGAFIHGTAANLINNYLRSHGRHPRAEMLPDDLPGPDNAEILERDSDIALLRRGIASLDRHDRQVLTLTLVDGVGPEVIARRTGLTQEAVRQRKSRALKRLKELLNGASRDGHRGPQR